MLRRRRRRHGHRLLPAEEVGLDVNSHGTHVTSTILGYDLGGTPVNGVAPKATVIPVKVLNQTGSGWSSVIARGIEYVGELKAGPLAGYPVVINMSLSGPVLDAVEQAAIDYAIEQGVIIVASAGNRGAAGMGYPGAYAPVISVAASGWVGEWPAGVGNWWWSRNVADPTSAADFYIVDFSSRAKTDQDLDIAAPGTLGRRALPVPNGQNELLLPGRHLHGQPPRGRHCRADGAKESCAYSVRRPKPYLKAARYPWPPDAVTSGNPRAPPWNSAGKRTPPAPACWMPLAALLATP